MGETTLQPATPDATAAIPGSGSASVSLTQMKLVLEVSRQLAVTSDLIPLLELMCRSATSMLQAERASVFVYDSQTETLWTKVALGTKEIRVPSSAGLVGEVFQTMQMLNIPDAYAHPKFNKAVDLATGFRTRNLLTAPMFDVNKKCVGVVQVVNKIGGGFSPADELLAQLLADQAGVAIQRYQLMQQLVHTAELRREMDLAQRVQQALIPTSMPRVKSLDVVGWTRPASITGGDTFDVWELDDGRLGVFLADASGHGIAPALVVSQARTLVRTLTPMTPDPTAVLARVNERLCADLQDGMFVTAFFAIISPDGKVDWYSAGHGPVYYRSQLGAELTELIPPSPPLGVVPFLPDERPESFMLATGGELAIMTDGIYESWSPQGTLLGSDKVTALLDTCQSHRVDDVLAEVKKLLDAWQDGLEAKDDQTVVLVKRV
jgi:phosphoserine phosphatase